MAKVELTGAEYYELMRIRDAYYDMCKAVSDEWSLHLHADMDYVTVQRDVQIADHIIPEIFNQFEEQLIGNPDMLRVLVRKDTPIINVLDGAIYTDYGGTPKQHEWDIRKNTRLGPLWEQFKAELEAEQNE